MPKEVVIRKDDILLKPGERLNFKVQVTAPTTASGDSFDSMLLNVSYNDGEAEVENTVITTVEPAQMQIKKTIAIDAACDGTADETFAEVSATDIGPGECAIWQMVIQNLGMSDARKVKIFDAIPPYTTYVPGSLLSGSGDAGIEPTPAVDLYANTDADDDADAENHANNYFGKVVGTDIIFHAGTGATQDEGGIMAPTESASFRFSTKVD